MYTRDVFISVTVWWAMLVLSLTVSAWFIIPSVCAGYRCAAWIHEYLHHQQTVRFAGKLYDVGFGWPNRITLAGYWNHLDHHRAYGQIDDSTWVPWIVSPLRRWGAVVLYSAIFPAALMIRYLLAPVVLALPLPQRVWVYRHTNLCPRLSYVAPVQFSGARLYRCDKDEGGAFLGTVGMVALLSWLDGWLVYMAIFAGIQAVALLKTSTEHHWQTFDESKDSINVLVGWVDRLTWAPWGLNYHGLHHAMPGVSYGQLAAEHQRLMASSDYQQTIRSRWWAYRRMTVGGDRQRGGMNVSARTRGCSKAATRGLHPRDHSQANQPRTGNNRNDRGRDAE